MATVPRPAPRASRLAGEHDAERRARQQARHGDRAEDRDLAAAERVRRERERRAHDQRAAVGGAELEEAREVAVHERGEGRRRLDVVVGEVEAEQAEPGERGGAEQRERVQGSSGRAMGSHRRRGRVP